MYCLPLLDAAAAIVGSVAQVTMDICLLLHVYEVVLAFSDPMAKYCAGKGGHWPLYSPRLRSLHSCLSCCLAMLALTPLMCLS